MLSNPRNAALIAHHGEIVGPGTWPPIIDVDTFHAVLGVLADPERHKAGPPRRYLLSGVATCGTCGLPVLGGFEARKGYSIYRCPSRAHFSTRIDPVDDFIEQLVIERLSQPDAVGFFARPDRVGEAGRLRAEEGQHRVRLDGLAEAYAAGDIDASQLRAGSARVRAALGVVETELASIVRVPDVGALVASVDVAVAWAALSLEKRRQIVKALLRVSLSAPGRGARQFDPDTVGVEWRTS